MGSAHFGFVAIRSEQTDHLKRMIMLYLCLFGNCPCPCYLLMRARNISPFYEIIFPTVWKGMEHAERHLAAFGFERAAKLY